MTMPRLSWWNKEWNQGVEEDIADSPESKQAWWNHRSQEDSMSPLSFPLASALERSSAYLFRPYDRERITSWSAASTDKAYNPEMTEKALRHRTKVDDREDAATRNTFLLPSTLEKISAETHRDETAPEKSHLQSSRANSSAFSWTRREPTKKEESFAFSWSAAMPVGSIAKDWSLALLSSLTGPVPSSNPQDPQKHSQIGTSSVSMSTVKCCEEAVVSSSVTPFDESPCSNPQDSRKFSRCSFNQSEQIPMFNDDLLDDVCSKLVEDSHTISRARSNPEDSQKSSRCSFNQSEQIPMFDDDLLEEDELQEKRNAIFRSPLMGDVSPPLLEEMEGFLSSDSYQIDHFVVRQIERADVSHLQSSPTSKSSAIEGSTESAKPICHSILTQECDLDKAQDPLPTLLRSQAVMAEKVKTTKTFDWQDLVVKHELKDILSKFIPAARSGIPVMLFNITDGASSFKARAKLVLNEGMDSVTLNPAQKSQETLRHRVDLVKIQVFDYDRLKELRPQNNVVQMLSPEDRGRAVLLFSKEGTTCIITEDDGMKLQMVKSLQVISARAKKHLNDQAHSVASSKGATCFNKHSNVFLDMPNVFNSAKDLPTRALV